MDKCKLDEAEGAGRTRAGQLSELGAEGGALAGWDVGEKVAPLVTNSLFGWTLLAPQGLMGTVDRGLGEDEGNMEATRLRGGHEVHRKPAAEKHVA